MGAPRFGAVMRVAAVGLVLYLALSPPYGSSSAAWEFTPSTLVAPLRSYLFRQAVTNTAWLVLGVTATVLALATLWTRMGLFRRGQARLLIVPLALTAVPLLRLAAPRNVTLWAALGMVALLLSQAFALELALGFTPGQLLPTLGAVITLADGDPAASPC